MAPQAGETEGTETMATQIRFSGVSGPAFPQNATDATGMRAEALTAADTLDRVGAYWTQWAQDGQRIDGEAARYTAIGLALRQSAARTRAAFAATAR